MKTTLVTGLMALSTLMVGCGDLGFDFDFTSREPGIPHRWRESGEGRWRGCTLRKPLLLGIGVCRGMDFLHL